MLDKYLAINLSSEECEKLNAGFEALSKLKEEFEEKKKADNEINGIINDNGWEIDINDIDKAIALIGTILRY